MSRGPRRCRADSFQHIISRFVDREFHFGDDADRHRYLEFLTKTQEATAFDWKCFSYALMSSHVHVGMLSGIMPLAALFHPLHTRFAAWWHKRHGGLGPIFADRPANFEVHPDLVPRMIAYHHRNPVTARVVVAPADSRWTSHRAYLRLDPAPPWLEVERGLALCGFSDTATGRRAFDEFVRDIDLADPHPFRGAKAPAAGELHFPRRSATREFGQPEWAQLQHLVLRALDETGETRLRERSRQGIRARRLFAMVARRLHRPYASIAEELGVSPGAVHHLLHRRPGLNRPLEAHASQLASEWLHAACERARPPQEVE